VVEMFNIMFLLAALVFALGVLIGSVLQSQAVDRRYRLIAVRVRELHELEEILAEQDETMARAVILGRATSDTPLEPHAWPLAGSGRW
jgi:hypothetical protein